MIALGLACCGPVPQPFRAGEQMRLDNTLLTVPGGQGVFVATVEGPEGWVGQAFATAMSTAPPPPGHRRRRPLVERQGA